MELYYNCYMLMNGGGEGVLLVIQMEWMQMPSKIGHNH